MMFHIREMVSRLGTNAIELCEITIALGEQLAMTLTECSKSHFAANEQRSHLTIETRRVSLEHGAKETQPSLVFLNVGSGTIVELADNERFGNGANGEPLTDQPEKEVVLDHPFQDLVEASERIPRTSVNGECGWNAASV